MSNGYKNLMAAVTIQAEAAFTSIFLVALSFSYRSWAFATRSVIGGNLQQIVLHAFTVLTKGVVILVTPRAPPRRGTDLTEIAGTSSERERSVSWCLPAGSRLPLWTRGCQSNPGTGNRTRQTNGSSIPGMLTLNLFPTILILWRWSYDDDRDDTTWVTCLLGEGGLLPTCSPTRSKAAGRGWLWEMAENWRPQGRLARHPSMRSRDWKLSCCNYRLWNRCGTH